MEAANRAPKGKGMVEAPKASRRVRTKEEQKGMAKGKARRV